MALAAAGLGAVWEEMFPFGTLSVFVTSSASIVCRRGVDALMVVATVHRLDTLDRHDTNSASDAHVTATKADFLAIFLQVNSVLL